MDSQTMSVGFQRPTTLLFDVFNTVLCARDAGRQNIDRYSQHIKSCAGGRWQPFIPYPPAWTTLPAWPDSMFGIKRLRQQFMVCTLSNWPLRLQVLALKNAGIVFDAHLHLDLSKHGKPELPAYMHACKSLLLNPSECMMVTANKTFGDIEAAKRLGMQWCLIRDEDSLLPTISHLADYLGCNEPIQLS